MNELEKKILKIIIDAQEDGLTDYDINVAVKQLKSLFNQELERIVLEILGPDNAYPGFSPDEVSAQYTQGWHDAKQEIRERLAEKLK